MSLATSLELKHSEIDEIEKHLHSFVEWFYDTYYQQNPQRLPVCKYTVHALLHLIRDIRMWGPAAYYWQFPEVPTFNMDVLNHLGAIVWHSRERNQISSSRLSESQHSHASTPTPHFQF